MTRHMMRDRRKILRGAVRITGQDANAVAVTPMATGAAAAMCAWQAKVAEIKRNGIAR